MDIALVLHRSKSTVDSQSITLYFALSLGEVFTMLLARVYKIM